MSGVYKSLSKSGNSKRQSNAPDSTARKNKQRVLALASRGITASLKDAKFDSKSNLNELNELAELYNCNNVLFFEARKGKDLYVWLSKVPNGPTVKLHAQNLHTMEELHFTGNCLKGSRPILSFDAAFVKEPHLRVIKELFTHTLGVPEKARKSKPFIDHVLTFSLVDGKIWIRNYQINEVEMTKQSAVDGDSAMEKPKDKTNGIDGRSSSSDVSLVEIGPRVVLTPIIIQEGSFGGPLVYENKLFVSPNQVRSELRRSKVTRHNGRSEKKMEHKVKKTELGLLREVGEKAPVHELDKKVLFA